MNRDDAQSSKRINVNVVVTIFIALMIDGLCMQMISLALPVLMIDFQISKVQTGLIGSYLVIGMGIGGIFAGWLADRLGRVKVVFYSLLLFLLINLLTGFAQNFRQFAVLSGLTGFGIAAVFSIGTLMVAEYVPTHKRKTILGTLQAGWSVGYIIDPVPLNE